MTGSPLRPVTSTSETLTTHSLRLTTHTSTNTQCDELRQSAVTIARAATTLPQVFTGLVSNDQHPNSIHVLQLPDSIQVLQLPGGVMAAIDPRLANAMPPEILAQIIQTMTLSDQPARISAECKKFCEIVINEEYAQSEILFMVEGYKAKFDAMQSDAHDALVNLVMHHILSQAEIVMEDTTEKLRIKDSDNAQLPLILSDSRDMNGLLPLLLQLKKDLNALSDEQRDALTKSLVPNAPGAQALDEVTTKVLQAFEALYGSHIISQLTKADEQYDLLRCNDTPCNITSYEC